MKKILASVSITFLLLFSQSCNTFKNDVSPADKLIDASDAKSVGEALILPSGTSTVQGTPPTPSTSTQAPKVTSGETQKTTSNGSNETINFQYSNVNGNLSGVYFQVEGSPVYYNTPINGSSSSRTGAITLPIGIPNNISNGTFSIAICIYDSSGRVSNIIRVRVVVTRFETPAAGKANAIINGQTFSAEAVCDFDMGSGMRGYGILVGNTGMIVLYNLKQGNNTLLDIVNGNINAQSQVWAGYMDIKSGELYYSVNGSASYNGKVVKVSGTFAPFSSSKRISISATGNCI